MQKIVYVNFGETLTRELLRERRHDEVRLASSPRSGGPIYGAYGILAPPIHRPLYLVADDVVDPIGGDEEDPVCVLRSRGYLKGLVLSQLVRDFREGLFGFIQAFIDSIDHTSEGGGLINARSGTGGLGASSGSALHRFWLVRLLAGINQPYHHTISHALILLC